MILRQLICLICLLVVDIGKFHEEDDDNVSLMAHPAFLIGRHLTPTCSFCTWCLLNYKFFTDTLLFMIDTSIVSDHFLQ